MAITDAELMFSTDQVLDDTTLIVSENIIDFGLNNGVASSGRDMGVGDPLEIFVRGRNVDALTNSSELYVSLWTHTTPSVLSGRCVYVSPNGFANDLSITGITLTTTALASYMIVIFRFPFGDLDQYVGLGYDMTVDNGANLLVTAGIVHTMTKTKEYASGLNFA